MTTVTIAVPVRNGMPRLERVLDAISHQRTNHDVEVLVCDSGSRDGSAEAAARAGAEVFAIEPEQFSHGGTRNLLARRARGEVVVFITQDAVPAHDLWLDELLSGFDAAEDVALTFGPYTPMPDASPSTRRELDAWFGSFTDDGRMRIDRLAAHESELPVLRLAGRRGFFTDANGAVRRECWERVPYRPIAYAEDQQLAVDMLRAGFAKVFVPSAAVEHSHDYGPTQRLRRCFDEWRGLHEVYGLRERVTPWIVRDRVLSPARADGRYLRAQGMSDTAVLAGVARAVVHHAAAAAGAVAGSRADRLPHALQRCLSLEGRDQASAGTP